MKFVSVRSRITFGLVFLLVTIMTVTVMLGIGPQPHQSEMRSRANLCETIAVSSALMLVQDNKKNIEQLLAAVTKRNDAIISTGIRRYDGTLLFTTGEHETFWKTNIQDSIETQIQVPLKDGDQDWASVEIRFQPISAQSAAGYLHLPWVQYVGLVASVSFLLFGFFLGNVLQQLNPSKAVPKRVRDALDQLAEGLLITDEKGRAIFCNEKFAKWSGKKAEKLVGVAASKYPVRLGANEYDARLPWVRALEDKTPQGGVPLILIDGNGKELQLSANSSPILGTDGTYRGVLTSLDDITELTEHKYKLAEARDAAENANKAKSDFLARMSHEIRTPMNAILGFTEVLRRGMAQSEQQRQEHLTTIQASGEHLLSLINDILDLSKIESGRIELELAPCSLHDVVSQVALVFTTAAQEKGIELNVRFQGPLPETIIADKVRLRQIIINLVGNAMKFTNEGSVTIVARMERATETPMVAVDVTDTGIGMPEDSLRKIFEPFSQADASIARRFGGTGLGLSISLQLAEAMGGNVVASSQVGQGSRFTVLIDPGSLDGVKMVEIDGPLHIDLKKPTETAISLTGTKILIVDDSDTNRKLASLFLRRAGAEVESAENGKFALDLIGTNNFDAVLMDMQMPVMDGVEATQKLRQQGYTLPIIALTANAMIEDKKKCLESGFTDFLAKPIDMERLLNTIARVVPGRHVIADNANHVATSNTGEPKTTPSNYNSTSNPLDATIDSELPMDDEDFREIVELFIDHLHEKLDEMRAAIDIGDYSALGRLAHWLKGSGGSAGFNCLSVCGKTLEDAARQEDKSAVVSAFASIEDLTGRLRRPNPATTVPM